MRAYLRARRERKEARARSQQILALAHERAEANRLDRATQLARLQQKQGPQ
jgi:hypothetical protein